MSPELEPVAGPDLLLSLAHGQGVPLHEQLEQRLRELVRLGRLRAGARLPSTRGLAVELGVSRGVVLEAYSQLVAEGYLTASQGAPTRVADTPSAERPPVSARALARPYRHSFDPGVPDLTSFPRESWLRSLRTAARELPFAALGGADPRGLAELRNELMSYLGRARAAAPEPEHTLIGSGFTQAFALLCRTLRDRGVEQVAVEDPGWVRHRLIAERAGLEAVPVPVDAQGLSVDALWSSGCEVVVVTPAHQFPTGVVLGTERRAALLEWAEEQDALIVEDDYDSELRLDRDAVGALQGLTPERVCHLGSASKRLAPGVGIGWMLSPSWLTGALTYEKGTSDGGLPVLEQLAFADFIARGELDRHLRRMRLAYRRRREQLLGTLNEHAPRLRVVGAAAGVFSLAYLPAGVNEDAVIGAAAAVGVRVEGLAQHLASGDGPPGLVLGYGNLSDGTLQDGLPWLAQAGGPHR